MKGQLDVKTPAEYIAGVDGKCRSDIAALDALIRRHAPELEPVIMSGMLGYGPSATASRPASSPEPGAHGDPALLVVRM